MSHAPQQRAILVVITARGGGDWPPVLALARGLVERRHRVSVLCDEQTRTAVQATGLDAIALPPELAQSEYFARHAQQIGTIDGTPRMVYPLRGWSEACLPFVRREFEWRVPDVVVSSLFGLPLSNLISSTWSVPCCFVNPAYYFGDNSARSWEEDFAEPSRTAFREDFAPLMGDASLVLHATDSALDFLPAQLPANHHYAGPLLWDLPRETPEFIEHPGHSWVLIGLSTIPQPGDLDMARMAIDALRDEPGRILVTLAETHEREHLGPLPDNVYVTDYVPHSQVLSKCRLVVSHAGHGTVIKSLYYGVPMVLIPLGRDQPGVAARAAAAGVAEDVGREDQTPDRIAEAIRRTVHDSSYRNAAMRFARRLQADSQVERACRLIEELAATRGR
jgi:UDP:flavonoid glycosyltransferase YjiC (YdhE family)